MQIALIEGWGRLPSLKQKDWLEFKARLAIKCPAAWQFLQPQQNLNETKQSDTTDIINQCAYILVQGLIWR